MTHEERILIVGGGIAGLTLATALHQQGIKTELIERSSSWQATGAGIAVQPNGMRVLQTLGLGTAIKQHGTRIHYWDFCDQQGKVLSETNLERLWRNVGPFIGIERKKLQNVLRVGISDVPCRLGTSIISLTQDERSVSVSFSDGSTGEYELVVGADGIASTVRKLILPTVQPFYTGQMVWRSIARVHQSEVTRVQFYLGEGCFFGLCPVGNGQMYGFGNVTEYRRFDPVQGRLERLRDRFAAFGGSIPEYLDTLFCDEQIHVSPIECLETAVWNCGRVVLIGDASHASSPMMGQGGCMAMEDAYVLAEELSRTENVKLAIDEYVTRRRARVSWVREQSRIVAESFGLPPVVRNAALLEHGDLMMYRRFSALTSAVSR